MDQKELLQARLAAVAELAGAAAADDESRWLVWRRVVGNGAEVHTWPSGAAVAAVENEHQADHIARWAPEQVLAVIATLRELVDAIDDPYILELLGRVVGLDGD